MLELYKNIKERRQELKMTQAELAKTLGYADKSMIAKIEKGGIDLPLSKIELFANALDTTPAELMGDSWGNDILDNARRELVDHLNGDAYQIALFQEAEREDALVDPSTHLGLSSRDTKQIEKIIKETRQKLTSQEGLMFDGDPASPEAIESILDAMELGMEMAKKKNKEKYTPKKYKKD